MATPLSAPGVNPMVINPSPAVTTKSVGAAGAAAGIADTAVLAAPTPIAFTARKRME